VLKIFAIIINIHSVTVFKNLIQLFLIFLSHFSLPFWKVPSLFPLSPLKVSIDLYCFRSNLCTTFYTYLPSYLIIHIIIHWNISILLHPLFSFISKLFFVQCHCYSSILTVTVFKFTVLQFFSSIFSYIQFFILFNFKTCY